MEQHKLISVLIAAYNHEKFVDKAIKSIIDQSYDTIELIIIDDGSKDDTWKIIQSFREECKKRFKRVVFETQTNHGTCYTFNKLISLAMGEYIYMIASDDMAKENALELEYDFLEKNPEYVLSVGNNEFINAKGERVGWDEDQNSVSFEQAKYKTFAEFLKLNELGELFGDYRILSGINCVPNGYLIRAESLKKVPPFTPEAPLEDYYMMLQLSKLGKMKFIDTILFSYRWHSNNTMKQKEKIILYGKQTLCYEDLLIRKKSNKKWEKIFLTHYGRKEILFDLKIIACYWITSFSLKRFYIKLSGMRFCLFSIKQPNIT